MTTTTNSCIIMQMEQAAAAVTSHSAMECGGENEYKMSIKMSIK